MRETKWTLYILDTGEVRAIFYDKLAYSSGSIILSERRSQEKEASCLSVESTENS